MNQVVKIKVRNCEAWMDQLLGKLIYPNENLFFKTRFGIHTFFLREPIDVVISAKGKVQSLKPNLKPWKLFFWNPKYDQVVELPRGYIKEKKIILGDTIRLCPHSSAD